MSSEFQINRPGVYRRRDGEEVCLWPTFADPMSYLKWIEIGAGVYIPNLHASSGRQSWKERLPLDIVAYVGPLPAEILQRMAEALAAAEYQPQQTAPATFGEALKALAEGQPQ
jgi:hypothetical protein